MTMAIKEESRVGVTHSELAAWVCGHAALRPAGKVFAYIETIEACSLHVVPALANWALPAGSLAGRVFGEKAEIRWQVEAADLYGAWSIEEVAPGTAESRQVTAAEKRTNYYLIGLGTTTPGVFAEARYPGETFRYPLDEQFGADHANARAYIEVQEYQSPEPSLAEIEALNADDVTMLLNRPRLVAHRFVRVDVNMGEH